MSERTASVVSRAALLGLLAVMGGCAEEAGITQYKIPKPEKIQLPVEQLPVEKAQEKTESRPERMLGAIVPAGSQTWFSAQ